MSKRKGKKPTALKRIFIAIQEGDYLNTDLVLALRDWKKGLKEGKFSANAQTTEETILRTEVMMRGIENSRQLAENHLEYSLDYDSEAGLRARLSDEMAWCIRKGGILLPTGEVESNVPAKVEEFIYEIKPQLKDEVQREIKRQREGGPPRTIEGHLTDTT